MQAIRSSGNGAGIGQGSRNPMHVRHLAARPAPAPRSRCTLPGEPAPATPVGTGGAGRPWSLRPRALRVVAFQGPREHVNDNAGQGASIKQDLLAKGTPGMKRAFSDSPGFCHAVETHQLIAQRVAERLPGGLTRAPAGAAGADGSWSANSLPGAVPASTCILTYGSEHLYAGVQVFQEFMFGPPGAASQRLHTQTVFHTPDGALTPGLTFSLSMRAHDSEYFVLCGALGQKLNLGCHLDYVDKYYNNTPRVAPPAAPPQPRGSGGAAAASAAQRLVSFSQLEEEAFKDPSYRCQREQPRTVRARSMASGGMFFRITRQADDAAAVLERVRHYALSLTDIWLGHMLYDIATGEGRADSRGDCIARECALASQVERSAARLDPNTQLLVPVYGKGAVEAMLATMAAEPPPAKEARP